MGRSGSNTTIRGAISSMRGMVRVALVGIIASLLTHPASSQFGVAGGRKRGAGTTFEEMNEMAKKQPEGGGAPSAGGAGGLGGGGLDDLLNMDADGMAKMFEKAMDDPAIKKMMEQMGGAMGMGAGGGEGGGMPGAEDMADAFANLNMEDMGEMMENMKEAMKLLQDPEKLAEEVTKAMDALNSEDVLDALLSDKEGLLEQMGATGLLPEEVLAEYKNNPDKIASDVKKAMGSMKDLFNDPKMMDNFQEMLKDPAKILESMGDLEKFFQDDEKIEEARLLLLKSPQLMESNPALAGMYNSDEMREILNDPVKWRETVKQGQGMAFGGQAGAGAGAGAEGMAFGGQAGAGAEL